MPYQILIVDDDPDFREEMRECLKVHYRILEAGDGHQAIDLIKKPNAIDVVILDVIMPGLSGTEVLKQIRRINPNVGIIILTGRSSKDTAIEAVKGHADDYIEKPFHMEHFFHTVEKVLHRHDVSGLDGLPSRSKIERVKRFLERNVLKKITMTDAALEVCLNPKYLSRIFKKRTGLRFSDYRLKLKMEKAKELLKRHDAPLHQLSEQLGYKNVESFVRIFKKLVGKTPTTYRNSHPTRRPHVQPKRKKTG